MSRLSVQLSPLSVPLRRPLRTGQGAVTSFRGVRVRVAGEDVVGWGEATPVAGRGVETVERIEALLAGFAARGLEAPLDLASVDAVVATLPVEANATRYGIELALLDWLARRRQLPLARLLASETRSEIRVNAIIDGESSEELAEAAAEAVDAGHDTLKLKVGGRPLDEDTARVQAVRRRVGEAIRIRVDANGGWSPALASRALELLAPARLELCEQPVSPEEPEALERLAKASICPIAADESVPWLLEARSTAVRLWVLKPAALGGLRACQRIAKRARALGAETIVTAGWEGTIARLGAVHLAAAIGSPDRAHGLGTGAWMDGADGLPLAVHGRLHVQPEPGLGLEGMG